MKALIDTSVYVSHYRFGHHRDLLDRVNSEHLLYLHAVVLTELMAGARTKAFIAELERLKKTFETRDRLLVPGLSDYLQAGNILRRRPSQDISMSDALLASTARHQGALVITEDKGFLEIKKTLPFQVDVVKASVR